MRSIKGWFHGLRRKGIRQGRCAESVSLGLELLEGRWLLSALPGGVLSGWAIGGDAFDDARTVAVDPQGNLLVGGTSFSAGWPSGGFDTTWGGEGDAYVAKFSPDGQHLWSTYLGGDADDGIAAMVVDEDGFIYVAGWTRCAGWVAGGYDTSYGGAGDGFLAKLSPGGEYLWATYLGGSNWDAASALCLTSDGRLFVAGTTSSSGWIRKGFDTTYNGGTFDGFAALVSKDGEFLWSTYLGGSGWDYGYAVVADATGLYVAGKTSSSNWVAKGFDLTYAGGNFDGYLVRLSLTGQHVWSTYLGGAGEDAALSVAAEGESVYVAGGTTSPELPFPGIGEPRGDRDGFVAALSKDGQCLWGSRLGGDGPDEVRAVLGVGPPGIMLVGTTASDGWLFGGQQTVRSGETDGFIVRLSPTNGEVLWGSYCGGPEEDIPLAAINAPNGAVVVAGMTYQPTWLPNDPWGFTLGDADGFVATIAVNQPPTVGAVTTDRLMIAAPSILEIQVLEISDGDGAADVAGVAFYQDANHDGLWSENDRLLGQTDQVTSGTAVWDLEISGDAWPIGCHRVFALALDRAGAMSDPAVLDLIVTKQVDLGIVEEVTVTESELAAGVVVYHFIAAHDAFLTLIANSQLPTPLRYTLYTENPLEKPSAMALATGDLTTTNLAAEIASLEASQGYYLLVESTANEASWTMLNLHSYDPVLGRHLFWDTAGDDVFEISWSGQPGQDLAARIVINGQEMILPLEHDAGMEFVFSSSFGRDTIIVKDTAADDCLTGWLDRIVFSPGGCDGGSSGAGYRVEEVGFAYVYAYAQMGGMDRARFYDRAATGEETAKIKVKCEPQFHHVKMIAPKRYLRAKFFDSVEVFADGGGDQAVFYDSPGNDEFTGSWKYGRMTGPGYEVTVFGVPFIWAYSQNGGYDRVRFVDSVMKDEFSFKPHKAELFDLVTGGSVYRLVARGFDHTVAEVASTTEEFNKAAVWDTLFSDYVEASGNRVTLSRTTSPAQLLLEVRGFELVKIRPSSGGTDRIAIREPLEIVLTVGEGWGWI
ncbi:MAG: SBBP repeat-containing protein [Thermogutta sp.]